MNTTLSYAYIRVNNIHDEKTGAWKRTYSFAFCDITRHDSHPSFRILADLLGILQPSPLSQGQHIFGAARVFAIYRFLRLHQS